jgi:two-component system chemotaxis response regulator CheB
VSTVPDYRGLRPGRDLDALVIGGSAGSFEVLRRILPPLRTRDLVAIVVIHQSPNGGDIADAFRTIASLPCATVEDKQPVLPGTLWFAPPGYHLLVEREGCFSLSVDAPVNFSRPSIDVLFESAAEAWGPRLAGLVLTGANDDGARGLARIAECGGIGLVQDPADAEVALMPTAAQRMGRPRAVLDRAAIAGLFASWSAAAEVRP